jgi:hypothetical protein
MKTALVSLSLLVLLGGCSATPAPPGTSPTPTGASTPTASSSPSTESASPASTATPTPSKDAPKDPVSLNEAYTYSDGLKVEVVKVKLTKLSEEGGMDSEYAPGVPIQIVSVVVTNGSGATVDLDNSDLSMTYGPKKRDASGIDDVGTKTLYGKLKAGATKTGRYGFVAPEKDLDEVTLRFAIDSGHPAARFKGSLR